MRIDAINLRQLLRPARIDAVGDFAERAETAFEIALHVRRALPMRAGARGQLVGARLAPGLHELARHLDVALEADVAVVDHVSPG